MHGDQIVNFPVIYRLPIGIPQPATPPIKKEKTYCCIEPFRWQIVKWAVVYNLCRDVLWGYLSITNDGFNWQTTDSIGQKFGAQWLYPTVFMASVFALKYLSFTKRKMIIADTAIIAGASIAIWAWNLAEYINVNNLKAKGYSDSSAHYLSFWATGLAEGLTNCIVNPVITRTPEITKQICKKHSLENVLNAFGIASCLESFQLMIRIAHSFLVGLTLGAIGGAVWEVVFMASVQGGLDPLLGGICIALSVGLCNFVSNYVNQLTFKYLTQYQQKQLKKHQESQPEIVPTVFLPQPVLLPPAQAHFTNIINAPPLRFSQPTSSPWLNRNPQLMPSFLL